MTTAFAWLDGSVATKAEKADAETIKKWADVPGTPKLEDFVGYSTDTGRLHTWGEHAGQLYIWAEVSRDDLPLEARMHAALAALFAKDKRIRKGHFFTIGIVP
jgi:hypothetical protein